MYCDGSMPVPSIQAGCVSPVCSFGPTCPQQNVQNCQPELDEEIGVLGDAAFPRLQDSDASGVAWYGSSWPATTMTPNSIPEPRAASCIVVDSVDMPVAHWKETTDATRITEWTGHDEVETQQVAEDVLLADDWLDAADALMLQQADVEALKLK